jgi:S-formylglutathione hydrolase FrmB
MARTLRRTLGAGLALGVLFAATSAPASAALTDSAGIRVVSQQSLDSRLLSLRLASNAVSGPLDVRVLLPADYAGNPHRRYPVLYLFDGTSGRAADWTTLGDAERTTAGLPVIVVMPDIGISGDGGGWCTNWQGSGPHGRPDWETFHIGQLIPWVDHGLRTIRARAGRAIAGLSQGGFCSMSYAARHPDLFAAALSTPRHRRW